MTRSHLNDLKERLADEIRVAAEQADATPLERFVAEALTSDDAKQSGLVDRVWVVSLPDARKAIAAISAWRPASRRQSRRTGGYGAAGRSAPNLDAGVVGDLVEALERIRESAFETSFSYRTADAALAKYATQGTGGGDWIDWHGGLNPVGHGVEIEARSKQGRWTALSQNLAWKHYGDAADIIAYRLATHQPAISTDRSGPFSPAEAKIPGGDASNGAADREGAGE